MKRFTILLTFLLALGCSGVGDELSDSGVGAADSGDPADSDPGSTDEDDGGAGGDGSVDGDADSDSDDTDTGTATDSSEDGGMDSDSDVDSDGDADSDSDTGGDVDSDSDSDSDTETASTLEEDTAKLCIHFVRCHEPGFFQYDTLEECENRLVKEASTPCTYKVEEFVSCGRNTADDEAWDGLAQQLDVPHCAAGLTDRVKDCFFDICS